MKGEWRPIKAYKRSNCPLYVSNVAAIRVSRNERLKYEKANADLLHIGIVLSSSFDVWSSGRNMVVAEIGPKHMFKFC